MKGLILGNISRRIGWSLTSGLPQLRSGISWGSCIPTTKADNPWMVSSQSTFPVLGTASIPSLDSNLQPPSFHGHSGSMILAEKLPLPTLIPPIFSISKTRLMAGRTAASNFTCRSASHVSGYSSSLSQISVQSAWSI